MGEEKKRIGRPPVAPDSEVLNILVPKEIMQRVRGVTKQRAATIAGWVRQAMEEKLEREHD